MPIQIVDVLPVLPPRPRDAHKGDFGRVLVVAGSRGMSGAAALCASAALRGGAGLVRVAVPAGVLPFAADANPLLVEMAHEASVLAVGPGLGRGLVQTELVRALLTRSDRPLVLDA